MARWRGLGQVGTGFGLAVLLAGPAAGQSSPVSAGRATRPASTPTPTAFLIYLIDGRDPIVVRRYVEEDNQVRFEKYGGWVGIPRYEVLRIVPDEPETAPPVFGPSGPGTGMESAGAPAPGSPPLYVTTRGGANLRATAIGAEGQQVRVSTPEGSFTMPRADLLGVLRVPAAPASPEAWITVTDSDAGGAIGLPSGEARRPEGVGPAPAPARAPTVVSERPHLLQLQDGVVLRIDGFWIEGGEIRFRRLGGVVGFALSEVARLLPQEPAPAAGRVAVRFLRRTGPDRIEVQADREVQRIRLIGVDPLPEAPGREDPWTLLDAGLLLQLEFDRQRYDPGGEWLAYVYLPSGRMLNAELIRAGRARPRAEPRNIRYVDLFGEIWATRDEAR